MRRRSTPDNAEVVRVPVFGPHPITVEDVATQDANAGRAMAGESGAIRWGDPAQIGVRFAGEGGKVQDFRGGAFVGASSNLRTNPDTALPNTKAPNITLSPVMAVLAQFPDA